jgi:hypothetical protein
MKQTLSGPKPNEITIQNQKGKKKSHQNPNFLDIKNVSKKFINQRKKK